MTLDSFIERRNGTICSHPKGITGQCVCLIRCYFDDVLDFPQFPGVQSARHLWNVLDQMRFERIPNTLFAVPQRGDIFIIDAFRGNPHGHTGIVTSANMWSFTSFDSNWSYPLTAANERHGYLRPRVLGWFRPEITGEKPTIERVNEALRQCGDDPTRSVGTLTLSKWWQNRVASDPEKFTDDARGYNALVNAIKWHQANKKYPHDV